MVREAREEEMTGSYGCRKEEGRDKELTGNISTPVIKGKIVNNPARKKVTAEKTGDEDRKATVEEEGRKLTSSTQGRNRKTGVSSNINMI